MPEEKLSLQAAMDVLAACLAHEMGKMAYMMPNISKVEMTMYSVIEEITMQRLPDYVLQAMLDKNVFEKAHKALLEAGFVAWEMCELNKKSKQSSSRSTGSVSR